MPTTQKVPRGPFHPGYGCAIFILVLLTFSGIITWAVYTLLTQDKEISSFTTQNAPPLPLLDPGEDQKSDLRSKMEDFVEALEKNQAADLTLSVGDLNTMLVLAADAGIGGQDDTVPYMDMIRFSGFDVATRHARVDLRLPINKLPWGGKEKRFLVGTAELEPLIENNAFEVKLYSITIPGKTLPDGFLATLRTMPWLSVAKTRTEVASALGRITSFDIRPDCGAIVLHAAPPKKDAKPVK